jgi:hypothetical protein
MSCSHKIGGPEPFKTGPILSCETVHEGKEGNLEIIDDSWAFTGTDLTLNEI